jgi:uncharacterized protein YodC (DUF2158 family)
MSFNIGEVVKLKSGGPYITVTSISTSPDRPVVFVCQWIDKDGRAQTGTYPAEALIGPSERKTPAALRPAAPARRGGGSGWMDR